jgi:hypothetical protein
MSELVVSGLVKRRSALAGEIEATYETLRKMVADLENLDATIVQFDPDFKVETIKPKGFRPPSDRSQMSRIILSTLRQASEPLTSRDIALQLLVERALDKSDLRLLRLMTKRAGGGTSDSAGERRGQVRTRPRAVQAVRASPQVVEQKINSFFAVFLNEEITSKINVLHARTAETRLFATAVNEVIAAATESKNNVTVASSLILKRYSLSASLPMALPIAANLVSQRQTRSAVC